MKIYMRQPDAADYIGMSESYLEKARVTGKDGPPFARLGRAIVYDVADLDAWIAARKRLNTSQGA